MKRKIALAALLLLFPTFSVAKAGEPPPALVKAIARQESGQNPLAVNIAGKPHYPATREEAERLIQRAVAEGRSFDVGTMQVNSWWMERLGIDPFSLLDPATNERWGKWILAEEIARHGLNWKAVGKYHSPDPERGRQYAWLVYRHYAGQRASKIKEVHRADQKTHTQNVSDPGGTRANQGIGQQGGPVPLHVQQKGLPWGFRPKPGASGGED
ncbi:lytic transglycosylase domain-containing protein [Bilophila wadsworthia]|uniref:lytic transglycosylase domain-containing protein n=1 Tax=Bilophila wadsworthia TaxID=35833 RepID=UPI003AB3AEC2